MKTLVIHPKDSTTDFLSEIYKDKNWTVTNTNTSKKFLKDQIKTHDRIIMLGHGTEKGLLGFNKFVIDSTWVYLLRDKNCVCVWCNADKFVEKYNLNGFYTGMIISELEESYLYSIPTDISSINESNKMFALSIKDSILIEDDKILDNIKSLYDSSNNNIIKFNKQNLYFN